MVICVENNNLFPQSTKLCPQNTNLCYKMLNVARNFSERRTLENVLKFTFLWFYQKLYNDCQVVDDHLIKTTLKLNTSDQ